MSDGPTRAGGRELGLTLLDHLLDGARRVDLHGVQVVEPVHLRRVLGELLPKRIGQVVRRVRGLYRRRLNALNQGSSLLVYGGGHVR